MGAKKERFGLNRFQLKVLALVSMAVDHIGAILFPEYSVLRILGRLAFPIYAFLLVEGFFYTRNVKKYLICLGVFAIVSEIPYDLAFRDTWFYIDKQNIFFTLFLGLGIMCVLENSGEWPEKIIGVLLAMWVAELLRSDYGYLGILLIICFYVFRGARLAACAGGAVWNFLWTSQIQRYGAFAMIPIMLYNGKNGPEKISKTMKYFFYLFYPMHLLVLCLIERYIM